MGTFDCVRNRQAVFQSGCTVVQTSGDTRDFRWLRILPNTWYCPRFFLHFSFLALSGGVHGLVAYAGGGLLVC